MFRQACISTVGFPQNVDYFLEMIDHRLLEDEDPLLALNMDVLLRPKLERDTDLYSESDYTTEWTAPSWFMENDVIFFYHSVRAAKWSRMVQKQLISTVTAYENNIDKRFMKRKRPWKHRLYQWSLQVIKRAIEQADEYSGTIFATGRGSGNTECYGNGDNYWKSRFYAPISGLTVFERPLPLKEFEDVVRISQSTITPLYQTGLNRIREKLSEHNRLPSFVADAVIPEFGFKNISSQNWREVISKTSSRFLSEIQVREYFVDRLLEEIKDSRTSVLLECRCFRNNTLTGIVDYMACIGGWHIPIEAKINIYSEADIASQLARYAHVNSFVPTVGIRKGISVKTTPHGVVLAVDSSGVFLWNTDDNTHTSLQTPRWRRGDLPNIDFESIRHEIVALLYKGSF
jgi:hypothetical protein